jgi:dimeric dUTPase (all-alpha-NTP-PPase superfamily)
MEYKKDVGQDLSSALREISTSELREATLALGLKLGTVDLSWETFGAQFNAALERFQAANMDITTFVLLKDMVEQTKRELYGLKHSTYLALTQLLQSREEEDYNAYQKQQKNKQRTKKRPATETPQENTEKLIKEN